MTWGYSPEPRNAFPEDRMREVAREEFMGSLRSQGGVLGGITPRSLPQNAVITPFVTTLPVTAQDGDEVRYLADSTAGVVWHLRYRASAPSIYRWEFIGGSSLYSEVATEEVYGPSGSSDTFGDLATVGPSVALPLAGDYDVQAGCRGHVNGVAGFSMMSYAIGGTAAVDADALVANEPAGDHTSPKSMARWRRKTGLDAVTLTAKYRNNNTTVAGAFSARWIAVTPVRVGRT